MCALGALYKAMTGNALGYVSGPKIAQARGAMGQVILEQYADRGRIGDMMPLAYYPRGDLLVFFNNARATTAAEVVAVMEKAAANLQEQGQ